MSAVERFVRYSTRVQQLTDAWEFVMDHLDLVGEPPSIEISPTWGHFDAMPDEGTYIEPTEAPLWFEVTVAGTEKLDRHATK